MSRNTKGKQSDPRIKPNPKAVATPAPAAAAWPALLLILVVGGCAYFNSFEGQFLLDDNQHILENPRIGQFESAWDVVSKSRRPVVDLSLALNYAFGEFEVAGYHLFNLAVHLLAGMTLFGLIRRTLLSSPLLVRYAGPASGLALASALLWVVHPLQTQSVTYIIQRGESLMGLFYLLTLYAFLRGTQSSRQVFWYGLAVCCSGLAMGSKAVAVTAPVIVLLFDRTFLSESLTDALKRRWAVYIGLAATWSVLAWCGVIGGVLNTAPVGQATVGFGYKGVSPLQYAATQPGVILHYLRLSFWPSGLCLDYLWAVADSAKKAILPSLLIGALTLTTLWATWRRKPAGFLGAWFLIILGPTSSFVPIQDIAFEHRMYLSLAAVVVLAVFIGDWFINGVAIRSAWPPKRRRETSAMVTLVIVVALAATTRQRNKVYHSAETMWQDVLAHNPLNARAHMGLGYLRMADQRPAEAIPYFEKSLEIAPYSAETHFNLGVALNKLRRTEEAKAHYEQAIELQPRLAPAHNNLAVLLQQQGSIEASIKHYRAAIEYQPNNAGNQMGLGNALLQQGKFDEAAECYVNALRSNPGWVQAHYNAGIARAKAGDFPQAIMHFKNALAIKPDFAPAVAALRAAQAESAQ